jgi:hypothetical protein
LGRGVAARMSGHRRIDQRSKAFAGRDGQGAGENGEAASGEVDGGERAVG